MSQTTHEERVIEMNQEIAVLKEMYRQNAEQNNDTLSTIKNLTEKIADLVTELRAKEIKDEQVVKDVEKLDVKLDLLTEGFAKYQESVKPTIARVQRSHARIDKINDSIFSNVGKVVFIVLLVGCAIVLGIDLSVFQQAP